VRLSHHERDLISHCQILAPNEERQHIATHRTPANQPAAQLSESPKASCGQLIFPGDRSSLAAAGTVGIALELSFLS
jgi:hypothetical protein